ncbi:hypothetical protein GCM10010441_74550 [Kitasatospora paracochleata]|uniref:CYTH domain-containing protein n=1 Tax=Kitasatospora paracochleata TaxID=58354 RepID=A0ABT1J1E4_9ACTN|nr:hypothetical protein [Kitasatospora paracochleata]MCP2311241.1 CYTH domain-containing protein [Kitasatospora paracochleata]
MSHELPKEGKYARIERERRFLLAAPPDPARVVAERRITDRYLAGTRLRLRRVEEIGEGGEVVYKLTQKLPSGQDGHVQGLITNLYLSPEEYRVLAALPAAELRKTRLAVPPFGVDVFGPPLAGLVLAEAEFDDEEQAEAFRVPAEVAAEVLAEVTDDPVFRGGALAWDGPEPVRERLAAYGLTVGEQT